VTEASERGTVIVDAKLDHWVDLSLNLTLTHTITVNLNLNRVASELDVPKIPLSIYRTVIKTKMDYLRAQQDLQ
jgi:hypothetical protein